MLPQPDFLESGMCLGAGYLVFVQVLGLDVLASMLGLVYLPNA